MQSQLSFKVKFIVVHRTRWLAVSFLCFCLTSSFFRISFTADDEKALYTSLRCSRNRNNVSHILPYLDMQVLDNVFVRCAFNNRLLQTWHIKASCISRFMRPVAYCALLKNEFAISSSTQLLVVCGALYYQSIPEKQI